MVGGKPTELCAPTSASAGGVAPFDVRRDPERDRRTRSTSTAPTPTSCAGPPRRRSRTRSASSTSSSQKDPLTYLDGDLPKRFQRRRRAVRRVTTRGVQLRRAATQNSYRTIVDLFGPGAPTPPTVVDQRPADGKHGPARLPVAVDAQRRRRDRSRRAVRSTARIGEHDDRSRRTSDRRARQLAAGPAHGRGPRVRRPGRAPAARLIDVDAGPAVHARARAAPAADVCVEGVLRRPVPTTPGGLGDVVPARHRVPVASCARRRRAAQALRRGVRPRRRRQLPERLLVPRRAAPAGVCWPDADGGCCDAGAQPPAGPARPRHRRARCSRRRRRSVGMTPR